MPRSAQQRGRGITSSCASGFEVIMTGAVWMPAAGWTSNGWVFVMLMAGAAVGVGLGKTLIRAVSFFGPRFTDGLSTATGGTGPFSFARPGGFGNGCRSGEVFAGVIAGGRRAKIVGVSGAASAAGMGVIVGGRRIGVIGVRVGRTMRAVSRFSALGTEPACSGRGGSAIRTVSFFGSAMNDLRA